MSLGETISAAGSKIRKAMSVPPQSAADISKRISGASNAQALDQAAFTKAAIESANASTMTEEGAAAREKVLQIKNRMRDRADEIDILMAAHEAAVKREAADAERDKDAARKARVSRFDSLRRELMADAAAYTAALTTGGSVGAVPAFRGILAVATKLWTGFEEIADNDVGFQLGWLADACLFELMRCGGVPQDLQARHAQYPDLHTVLSFPGVDRFLGKHEHADAPEWITSLQDELTDKLDLARRKVIASNLVDQDQLVAPPRQKWPARSPSRAEMAHGEPLIRGPATLEMYDAPEQPTEVQETRYASDGTLLRPVDHAALKEEHDVRMAAMIPDPVARAAMMRGEVPAAVDPGTQAPNPRPAPADGERPSGPWISQQSGPELIDTRKTAPGKEPPWQPGIEVAK